MSPNRQRQGTKLIYLPKVSFILILFSILSVFLLSGDVLTLFGYNFAVEGGSFIYKIHPSFYLLFVGYLSIFLYKGGKEFTFEVLFKQRNFLLLLACTFCFLYQVFLLKQPMAPVIVTWLTPVLIICLFDKFSGQQKRVIYKSLLIIVTFNALMGILEYIQGSVFIAKNYFSMESEELMDISEWGFERANALYGHPLIATLISATVVVGFYAKSIRYPLSKFESICMWVSFLSLPAFGGRTSIAVCLIIVVLISGGKFFQSIKGKHIPPSKMIVSLLILFSIPLLTLFLHDLGLFDSVLARLEDDNGSAETRLTAFYILFDTSFLEILFGDYNKQLFLKQLLYGTKFGIEIFWLAIVLQFGLLVSSVMVYILLVVHRFIYKHIGQYTLWTSLTFLLALSSGTGLASKTLMLSHFIILSLFLLVPMNSDSDSERIQNVN